MIDLEADSIIVSSLFLQGSHALGWDRRIGAACHFYFQALDIQWAFLHPRNQQIKRASFTRWKEALLLPFLPPLMLLPGSCADEGRWRVLLGGQHGRRSLEEA